MAWKKYSTMTAEEKNASWANFRQRQENKKQDEARKLEAIRKHDCKIANCGPVCTAFDW